MPRPLTCTCGRCKKCRNRDSLRKQRAITRRRAENIAEFTIIEERGPTLYERLQRELGPYFQSGSAF